MIKTREDVYLLVSIFYQKIKKDPLLSPIFADNISYKDWSIHINKLTDFWVTCLFGIPQFIGNPTKKHLIIDNKFNNELDQKHFGRWLFLWYSTIDSLFNCSVAQRAKYMAKNIATSQQMIIVENRKKNIIFN
ncbi:group III truncated hemoglobin [Tenacibaculum sp. 190130A14a]